MKRRVQKESNPFAFEDFNVFMITVDSAKSHIPVDIHNSETISVIAYLIDSKSLVRGFDMYKLDDKEPNPTYIANNYFGNAKHSCLVLRRLTTKEVQGIFREKHDRWTEFEHTTYFEIKKSIIDARGSTEDCIYERSGDMALDRWYSYYRRPFILYIEPKEDSFPSPMAPEYIQHLVQFGNAWSIPFERVDIQHDVVLTTYNGNPNDGYILLHTTPTSAGKAIGLNDMALAFLETLLVTDRANMYAEELEEYIKQLDSVAYTKMDVLHGEVHQRLLKSAHEINGYKYHIQYEMSSIAKHMRRMGTYLQKERLNHPNASEYIAWQAAHTKSFNFTQFDGVVRAQEASANRVHDLLSMLETKEHELRDLTRDFFEYTSMRVNTRTQQIMLALTIVTVLFGIVTVIDSATMRSGAYHLFAPLLKTQEEGTTPDSPGPVSTTTPEVLATSTPDQTVISPM